MSVAASIPILSRLFAKNTLNMKVWIFYLGIFFALELAQLCYRKLFCGVDYSCRGVFFSWFDIGAGLAGASIAMLIVWLLQFIRFQLNS